MLFNNIRRPRTRVQYQPVGISGPNFQYLLSTRASIG